LAVTSVIADTLPSFFAATRVLSQSAPTLPGLKQKSATTMRASIIATVRFITAPPMQSTIFLTRSCIKGLTDRVNPGFRFRYHYSSGGESILAHLHPVKASQRTTRITKRDD